jgi:lipopolysaccharide biosynthesis glycosyltransferase
MVRVKPEVKVRNLQMAFIKNPVDIAPIKPIYDERAVCIALASNESYMPYVGVMLSSLLAHADIERDYDIVIMIPDEHNPNLAKHKNRILNAITSRANITIRFIEMSAKIADLNLSLPAHPTIETYFRLFLPQLLPNHKKILYLDADMIVCADVSKLYDTDLKGNVIGAAHDPIFVSSEISPSFNKHEYALKTGLNHHDYFQAGVLLIDLEKLRNEDLCAKMLAYAGSHETEFADQDVLNIYLRGKVRYIDLRWNVEITPQIDDLIEYCPAALKNEYLEARKKAYIYHFAGVDKPWKMPTIEYAEKFWQTARGTPWYEEILLNMLQSAIFSIPARDWEYSLKITDDLFLGLKKAHAELSALGRASDFTKTFAKELEALSEETKLIYNTPHIYFYGAGVKGKELLNYFANLDIRMPDTIWDRAAKPNQTLRSIPVVVPDFDNLSKIIDTLFIIAIESKSITDKVTAQFKEKGFNNIMTYKKAVNVFSRELWLKMEKKS